MFSRKMLKLVILSLEYNKVKKALKYSVQLYWFLNVEMERRLSESRNITFRFKLYMASIELFQ